MEHIQVFVRLLFFLFLLTSLHWCSENATLKKLSVMGVSWLLATNVMATSFFSYLSVNNYPGGEAFQRLHQLNRDRMAGRLVKN